MNTYRWFLFLLLAPLLFAEDSSAGVTAIKGDSFRLEMQETENLFFFYGNVSVQGNNLTATCKEMEVVTGRQTDEAENIGPLGNVKKIIARGNVVIKQTDRTAKADLAEIDMLQGVITLTGKAIVTDSDGTLSAEKLVLDRTNRKATATPPKGEQVKVLLPVIPDIEFNDEEKKE